MYETQWLAAFAAGLMFSYGLYIKEDVRAAAVLAFCNIWAWGIVAFGAGGLIVRENGTETIYASEALTVFGVAMVVLSVVTLLIAVTAGYGDDSDTELDNLAGITNQYE